MTPVQALQQTLAGEHAAVYVYGVLGARLSASDHPGLMSRVVAAYTVHLRRRDRLTAMVHAMGAEPVAAAVSYVLPNQARTAAQIEAGALVTERRCATVYAQAVGSTSRAERRWAVDALTDAAVRQLGFGGEPAAFPGVPEL
jgi:Domain of unknown function (DUF4439)